MKKTIKQLPLLLIIFLSSCAVGYRVKDVDKALDRNGRELDKMEKKIGSDIKNKSKLLECFKEADSADAESLKAKIDELVVRQESISKLKARLEKSMFLLRDDIKGKKKMITSRDPEFPEFKKTLDTLEDESKELNSSIEGYSKVSNALFSDAKKKKIVLIDFDTLEGDMDKSATSTEKSISEANGEINKAKKLIAKSDVKSKEQKLANLDKMKDLLKEATEEASNARKTAKDMGRQFPEKGLVCLAPQNPSYAYVNEMNTHREHIEKIGKELKRLAAEINKK
jgi:hypothetical protein